MKKPGFQLKKHKTNDSRTSSQRPMLSLGLREKNHEVVCIICNTAKLVHRADMRTCSVKCRVAWHRLSPEEQQELLDGLKKCDELAPTR